MVNIQALIDDAKCFETVRSLRWPDGVRCPGCDSAEVIKKGCDERQPARRRYQCRACRRRFDDLTGTVFAGHHQPLRVWVLCLYLMGLNLATEQIAKELTLTPAAAQQRAGRPREGLVARKPEVPLAGEVECDAGAPWPARASSGFGTKPPPGPSTASTCSTPTGSHANMRTRSWSSRNSTGAASRSSSCATPSAAAPSRTCCSRSRA